MKFKEALHSLLPVVRAEQAVQEETLTSYSSLWGNYGHDTGVGMVRL